MVIFRNLKFVTSQFKTVHASFNAYFTLLFVLFSSLLI